MYIGETSSVPFEFEEAFSKAYFAGRLGCSGLSSWVLKTSKDGISSASLGILFRAIPQDVVDTTAYC